MINWKTEKRKISDLIPTEKNPRHMNHKMSKHLERSLTKFNLVELPVINTNNKIIAGHQRIKALSLLGRGGEEIEVRVPNRELTSDEADEYLLASNKINGNWDELLLKEFDNTLLELVGFDPLKILSDIEKEKVEFIPKNKITKCPECGHSFEL